MLLPLRKTPIKYRKKIILKNQILIYAFEIYPNLISFSCTLNHFGDILQRNVEHVIFTMLGVDLEWVSESLGRRVDDCTVLCRPFIWFPDLGRFELVGGLGARPFCGILGNEGVPFFWLK